MPDLPVINHRVAHHVTGKLEHDMLKSATFAVAILLGSGTSVQAAPVELGYTAFDLFGSGLDYLGLAPGDTITGQITYDDEFDYGPYNYSSGYYSYSNASDYGVSQAVTIGSVIVDSMSASNYVSILDGIADGAYNIYDYFYSYIDSPLDGVSGVTYSYASVYAYDYDESTWSGLVPTFAELNDASTTQFYLSFTADGQRYYLYGNNVRFHAIQPVPLPASGMVLLAGLGLFAGFKRRART